MSPSPTSLRYLFDALPDIILGGHGVKSPQKDRTRSVL